MLASALVRTDSSVLSRVVSDTTLEFRVDRFTESTATNDTHELVSVESPVEKRVTIDVSALARVDSSVETRVVSETTPLASVLSTVENRVTMLASDEAHADRFVESTTLYAAVTDVSALTQADRFVESTVDSLATVDSVCDARVDSSSLSRVSIETASLEMLVASSVDSRVSREMHAD